MSDLINYVKKHSIKVGSETESSVDIIFFHVQPTENPSPEALKKLILKHEPEFGESVDLFDGKEHSFLELGGWIGDQGLAMQLMGLGKVLGLWDLLTPRTVLGDSIDEKLIQQAAGQGYITIKS